MDKIIGKLPEGRYDGHIHILPGNPDPAKFANSLKDAGLRGAVILSEDPNPLDVSKTPNPEKAMDAAIEWAKASETIYPFYWIDPYLDNALSLVDTAIEKGMFGFKVIPGVHAPCEDKAMEVYTKIAKAGKPLVFHSGILWDGRISCNNHRPGSFEPLLDIANLRFSLAHVSWPWCEECVALYGKFLNARVISKDPRADMFIDTTPGTPAIRRESVLEMVFKFDYDTSNRVIFGTDCDVGNYCQAWSKEWQDRDSAIYAKFGEKVVNQDSVFRIGLQSLLFGGGDENRRLPTESER